MLQKGVCGFRSNLKKFSKWRKACVCTHLAQGGFLRCLHFLLQEQKLIEYSSLLLFISNLHLKRKSTDCLPVKQPFLPPAWARVACALSKCLVQPHLSIPPACWCQHTDHCVHVGWHASNSFICHQSFHHTSFPWLLGVCSVCSPSLLHRTLQLFGLLSSVWAVSSFCMWAEGIFFFFILIKGFCLQYQFPEWRFMADPIIIIVSTNCTNCHLQLQHSVKNYLYISIASLLCQTTHQSTWGISDLTKRANAELQLSWRTPSHFLSSGQANNQ